MKKTKHDGDCTIYSSLINGRPTDGICTCGYSHQLKYDGDLSEMYSEEKLKLMEDSARQYDILSSDEMKRKHSDFNDEDVKINSTPISDEDKKRNGTPMSDEGKKRNSTPMSD